MLVRIPIAAIFLLLAYPDATFTSPPPLPLNDGERILFLGNGFIENDHGHAYFETRLQRRFPDRSLHFRYMGWSGDTVRANARTAGYQVSDGLARLEKEVFAWQPTVIFLAYGMNESFEGPPTPPGFLADYAQLLTKLAPLKARLAILSPTYHEDLGRPFPDPAEHNEQLRHYTRALKKFARERGLAFVDLFSPLEAAKKNKPEMRLTTNGLLLTQTGYALTAKAAEEQLDLPAMRWRVSLDAAGNNVTSEGTKLTSLTASGTTIRFQAHDAVLPIADGTEYGHLRVTGFPAGDYRLKIDGQNILHASAEGWQEGVKVAAGPMFAAAEKLRAAIVLRNQLFYRRWRPYNDFSEHWGYISGDFKLYDREIAAQEQRIARLRQPRPLAYEITPSKR